MIVNILHDNTLTQDNRDKLNMIVERYNQQIKFYNVEQTCADKIREFYKLIPSIKKNKLTIGALFRLLITEVLPKDIKKIIYLDSDIIINLDIDEFWQIELDNKPLGVVPTILTRENIKELPWDGFDICRNGYVKWEDYFNSGVLLMNLKRLRNEKKAVRAGIKFKAKFGENSTSMDQYILNYCFASQSKKIPAKFNLSVDDLRVKNIQEVGNGIYHYNGSPINLGIQLTMQDIYNRLWMKYFVQTPWFNEEVLGRMYEGVQQIYADRQNFATYITAMMSGKTRAFFISPPMLEGVKNVFGVRADEEIILAENNESLGKLIKSANKKVFFISPDIYWQCREILIQAGLAENRDFINIINFLSDAQGVPLNSYQLIKLL